VYRPSYHHQYNIHHADCSPPFGRLASSSSSSTATQTPHSSSSNHSSSTNSSNLSSSNSHSSSNPNGCCCCCCCCCWWGLGWRRSVGCWMSVEFGLENTTINIIIAEQQQHAERSRGSGWMQQQPHEAPFNIIGRYMCQPNMDGAALTFKCLQRSVLGRDGS